MRAFSIPLRFSFDTIYEIQQLITESIVSQWGSGSLGTMDGADTQSHVRHNTEHMSRTRTPASTKIVVRLSLNEYIEL